MRARPLGPRSPARRRGRASARARGFSLVELVMVLTLLGVIGSIGATFVSRIVAGQQDNRVRLTMAQAADGALTRLGAELALALPNSVRVTVNAEGTWVEWVPVLDAGRYRQAPDTASGSPGDLFDPANGSDNSFDVISSALATPAPSGAQIAWANLGTAESDVYAGTNRRAGLVVAGSGKALAFSATGVALPADAGTGRFFIVGTPLTVACLGTPGAQRLVRFSGYGWIPSQPVSEASLAAASPTQLLNGLSGCNAAYGTALANIGLLNWRVSLLDATTGTSMDLLQQVPLDNTP